MEKFFYKLTEWLPTLWGILWMAIITFGSVALLIVVAKWLLSVLGVL